MSLRYGYKYGEVKLPKILPWKDNVRIYYDNRIIRPIQRPAVSSSIGCHLIGASLPHADPRCPLTTLAGALKRFCYEPPRPETALFKELLQFTETIVSQFTPLDPFTDVSVETWLKNNNNYSDARKKQLLEKYLKVTNDSDPIYNTVKSFIKDEDYPDYKHSRCINSRSDEFKCFTGPIFHEIEKVLFKNPDFIKYVPVMERPDYLMNKLFRVGALFAETDYTSCEAHFDRLRMQIEFIFYRHMTSRLPSGRWFMNKITSSISGKNKCIFKDFILYVIACRMSGEMNTSLGNGFDNWILSKFIAHKTKSTGHSGVFEGDDGAVVGNPLPTQEMYEKLGFNVKLKVKEDISAMSFCGMIFDQEDKINITNPIEELCSFGWTTLRYVTSSQKTKLSLLRAKSISMMFQYAGCPILHELALYGLRVTSRLSTDRIARFMNHYERELLRSATQHYKRTKFLDLKNKNVPTNTRILMEKEFGVSIENQLSIESYLRNKQDVSPLDIPVVLCYCPVQWTDYYHRYVVDYRKDSFRSEYYTNPPFDHPRMERFVPEWIGHDNLFLKHVLT